MAQYRLKEGLHFEKQDDGSQKMYSPGDIIEETSLDLSKWPEKFELVQTGRQVEEERP